MAVFRVERNKGYTVMSNHHLRNRELSLKAKGLLSQMLSLPEDWDYTLAGLSHINREKIDAIREAIKELEQAGYIVRSRTRDEKGRLRGADYVIYEQPPTLDLPTLENPTLEKPTQENPTLENPMQLNKEILIKDPKNKDGSIIDSIPILSPDPFPLETAMQPERKRTEGSDAYKVYKPFLLRGRQSAGAEIDFILSLCELMLGGKEGLQPIEKTVIDRAVQVVYRPYFADPIPENMPVLGDLYAELLKQPEPEAARVAAALELYVSGSLNFFNHRTNVEIGNRLVCFDIKQLGQQLKKLGMLIIHDQVWNRVTINRAASKATRYYMDEFHLLLREEQTSAYSVEIWRRFRKWGGMPTGITQNVKSLLASREVEDIFEDSDFILMLNQAVGDQAILAKQLVISPQQMKFVTHSDAGEGLLFYGNVILPFVDRFPKDTELYRVMTTKPEEVGGA